MITNDPVNHPQHYISNDPLRGHNECIDYIKDVLGDKYSGYLLGNAIKYIWRHDSKGKPIEDLKKAQWYLARYSSDVPDTSFVIDPMSWVTNTVDSEDIFELRDLALYLIEIRRCVAAYLIVGKMISWYVNQL